MKFSRLTVPALALLVGATGLVATRVYAEPAVPIHPAVSQDRDDRGGWDAQPGELKARAEIMTTTGAPMSTIATSIAIPIFAMKNAKRIVMVSGAGTAWVCATFGEIVTAMTTTIMTETIGIVTDSEDHLIRPGPCAGSSCFSMTRGRRQHCFGEPNQSLAHRGSSAGSPTVSSIFTSGGDSRVW